MIYNQIDQNTDAALPASVGKLYKVTQRAVPRINAIVIRNIIAIVTQRRRLKWHEPDRGNAQALQVVQPVHETAKVTNAITICIHICVDREAIDDRILVPEIVDHAFEFAFGSGLSEKVKLKGAPERKMQATEWWQRGIIYEVYPRSFQDSNNDGIGDLPGILARLEYLVELGVNALWIAPIFPSPMADFGYDVADYCNIDPIFGTLADFDRLLAAVHERGLKLILDFVPNHTSDQHPWFLESRSSRDNPKRDWYLWRDAAADGGAPNNWLSNFGGSAWEWDATTGQYYCHSFLKAAAGRELA